MKKVLVIIYCVCFTPIVFAQRLHINVFSGLSNYQGDLQEKRFTFNQSHRAFGGGILYEITDQLLVRANITIGKLSGNDAKGTKNVTRNLNFTSSIVDYHLGLEYHFFNLHESKATPYVFAGISYFHFNPYTFDSVGNKVFLQPLSTEGQGFYQGRKAYKLSQFAIPFGGGVKFAISDNIQLGLELGLRKTNTDYMDDVSSTFVDQNILLANRGQQAVDLAFRGDELKTGLTYPVDGTTRGNSKYKDWYYFTGATLSFRLNGGGGRSKVGCPARVY